MAEREGAGLGAYLKEAFLFRWNVLLLLGGVGVAALSPIPDILIPLVGAAELTYLAGLTSIPRFRAAVDARARAKERGLPAGGRESGGAAAARPALAELLAALPPEGRRRFEDLRRRCLEMRSIAHGVGGRTEKGGSAADEIRGPGLDRLLWVFLRLLHSRASLARFLEATSEPAIAKQAEEARRRLASAEQGGDERAVRSLRDSLATAEVRLDNFRKARQNAEFVGIEIDRIEGKIQTLSEMAVNRQDPDFLSREVDSVAASMEHTEQAMSELHLVTGMMDGLAEPPPILDTPMKEIVHGS